ncbi:MAG: phage integrase N-terminal SAM-like domain-containing protein [Planctomycetota bacterium]
MTELRRRMLEDMCLHSLAEATQQAYVDAVANLARYFKRSPDQVTEEELRRFFVSLTRRRAKSTVRVHVRPPIPVPLHPGNGNANGGQGKRVVRKQKGATAE